MQEGNKVREFSNVYVMFSGKCEIVAPRARLELATLRFAPAKLFTSCNDPFLSLRLFAFDSSRKWRDVALWRYMGAHKEPHISKSFLPPNTISYSECRGGTDPPRRAPALARLPEHRPDWTKGTERRYRNPGRKFVAAHRRMSTYVPYF